MKKIIHLLIGIAPILLLLFSFGCSPDMDIPNLNAPDRERALASPEDVEKLAGGAFRQFWFGQTQYYSCPWSLSTMADELTSSWGNSGMRDTSSEPRQAWDNSPSYGYEDVNRGPWRYNYRAISAVNDVLAQINSGMQIIVEGEDHTAMVTAWCKFIQGIAYGFLGQMFDKAFLVDENTDLEGELSPVPYNEIHDFAMQKLQECIDLCSSNSFTIPEIWWPGNNFNQDDLKRLAHSFMARYMAGVARDPNERAAADWAAIKSHAQQGITEDFGVDNDGDLWYSYLHGLISNKTWGRADYKLIGPADTSGAYEAWLAKDPADRTEFLIETNDKRVTGGDPQTDGKYFKYYGPSNFRANRGTYHFSYYHSYKYLDYYQNGYVGWAHIMSKAEMDFLIAEAELRAGNAQAAVDIINQYHVGIGEMDPITTAIPVGSPGDERDGRPDIGGLGNSLWAVMKYNKGVEIVQKNCGVAWTDRRGWGTLVRGTIIHFPIPGDELETLLMENYTFGGVGQPGGAPKIAPPMMDMPKR